MPDKELEQIQFEYFLSATGNAFDSIDYDQEKPDIVATKGGQEYGIELTAGGSQELHLAPKIAHEKKVPFFCASGLHDQPNGKRRSKKELEKSISIIHCQIGEMPTIRWAERIAGRIKEKAKKLNTGTIRCFENNWLIVSDTSPEIASDRTEFLRVALMTALGSNFLNTPQFDLIYCVGCGNIFIIEKHNVRGISRKDCE